MNIFAITGCTGLLGRNLIFELFKQNLNSLSNLTILALGRSSGAISLQQRMKEILRTDGRHYLNMTPEKYDELEPLLLSQLECVDMYCGETQAGISTVAIQRLQSLHINYFIHVAALVDFRNTTAVEKELWHINVEGTQEILKLVEQLQIGELVNVGTAYACGKTSGVIQPDYINLEQEFRNPYERSKLVAEMLVREYEVRTRQKCRYFRPATICGRLIEPVWGTTHKFDVFYAWAGFFNHMKCVKMGLTPEDDFPMDFKMCYIKNLGLNIVPVDYCAKVMYQACVQNDPHQSMHLANPVDTPNDVFIPQMRDFLHIQGMVRTDTIPEQQNRLESLYYKTAGKIYTPYVTGEAMQFDVSNLTNVNIQCPLIDTARFQILLDYAQAMNFGESRLSKEVSQEIK